MKLNKYLLIIPENHKPEPPQTTKAHWYHGTLNRDEALKTLRDYCQQHDLTDRATDGVFLVRYSERHRHPYVLTMLSANMPHNYIIRTEVRKPYLFDCLRLGSTTNVGARAAMSNFAPLWRK